jgi:hypothetical protein
MLRVADCIADRVRLAIPQTTEWEHVVNKINAAVTFARANLVNVSLGGYGLPAIQAAKTKQIVMTPEKISGTMKKYFQLKNVTRTKHEARPHVTIGIANNDSLGSPPSCHDRTATKTRRTVTKRPKPV